MSGTNDNEINARLTVDISQAKSALGEGSAQFDGYMARVEAATRKFSEGGLGVQEYSKSLDRAAASFGIATGETEKFSLATVQAKREVIVLGHEFISGNFSRIPGSMMVLAERAGGLSFAMMGIGAAVAVATYSLYELVAGIERSERFMASLQNRMEFAGRGFAYNQQQTEQLVERLNLLPDVSKAAAREMVAIADSSNLTGKQIDFLFNNLKLFAEGIGKDIPTAFKEFESVLSNPIAKLKELDNVEGILNDTQRTQLDLAIKEGDTSQARSLAIAALTERFKQMHDVQTKLQSATKEFSEAWDHLMDSFGNSSKLHWIVDNALPAMVGYASELVKYLEYIYGAKAGQTFTQWKTDLAQARADAEAVSKIPFRKDSPEGKKEQQDQARQASFDRKSQIDASMKGSGADRETKDASTDIAETRRVESEKYQISAEYIRMAKDDKNITLGEEYQLLQTNLAAQNKAEQESFAQQLELWKEGSSEYQKILHDKQLADERYQLNKVRLEKQFTNEFQQEQKKQVNQMVQSFAPLESAFRMTFSSILRGQQSFSQIALNLADRLVENFVMGLVHEQVVALATEQVKTSAVATGEAARLGIKESASATGSAMQSATAQSSIGKSAAQAAASVYADVAAIPYIGWILAPPAAAAAFVAVEAFGSGMPSAAGGWGEIPHDTMAMVHQKEMILPANIAQGVRDMVSGGGSGGANSGGGGTSIVIQAVDAKSIQRLLQGNGGAIAKAMAQQTRSFNPSLNGRRT